MRINVEIAGTSPLMLDRFSDEAALRSSEGTTGSAAARDRGTPLEQAEARLYHGTKQQIIIPAPNLLACLVDGGRFHKAGRAQLTTQKSSMLYGCLGIDEFEVDLKHKQPWKVDTRPVRVPATGGRI